MYTVSVSRSRKEMPLYTPDAVKVFKLKSSERPVSRDNQ